MLLLRPGPPRPVEHRACVHKTNCSATACEARWFGRMRDDPATPRATTAFISTRSLPSHTRALCTPSTIQATRGETAVLGGDGHLNRSDNGRPRRAPPSSANVAMVGRPTDRLAVVPLGELARRGVPPMNVCSPESLSSWPSRLHARPAAARALRGHRGGPGLREALEQGHQDPSESLIPLRAVPRSRILTSVMPSCSPASLSRRRVVRRPAAAAGPGTGSSWAPPADGPRRHSAARPRGATGSGVHTMRHRSTRGAWQAGTAPQRLVGVVTSSWRRASATPLGRRFSWSPEQRRRWTGGTSSCTRWPRAVGTSFATTTAYRAVDHRLTRCAGVRRRAARRDCVHRDARRGPWVHPSVFHGRRISSSSPFATLNS